MKTPLSGSQDNDSRVSSLRQLCDTKNLLRLSESLWRRHMPQGSARVAEGMVNGHRASFHARLVTVGSGVTRHKAHISDSRLLWDPEKPFVVIAPTGPWAPVATQVRHLGARGGQCADYGKTSVQIPALQQSCGPERLLKSLCASFPPLTGLATQWCEEQQTRVPT